MKLLIFLQITKKDKYDSGSDDWMMGWWIYCIGSDEAQDSIAVDNYRYALSKYMIRDRKRIVPLHCELLNSMKII